MLPEQLHLLPDQEKSIGQDHALFFEAYATYYELRGNCPAADAVYTDGMNRCWEGVENVIYFLCVSLPFRPKLALSEIAAKFISRASHFNLSWASHCSRMGQKS